MMYVPEFVALYEIVPYIRNLPLNNESIRVAVKDYLEGGKKKDAIIKKYGKIEDWNTSEVTDMSVLFFRAHDFNQDISKWDTSNVTDMDCMFECTINFNADISKWDTSSVTSMTRMFFNAKNFNQDISSWDTSNVTNMEDMFMCAKSFNQDISGWDTSKVTNMEGIFYEADNFNLSYERQKMIHDEKLEDFKADLKQTEAQYLREQKRKEDEMENAPWYHE